MTSSLHLLTGLVDAHVHVWHRGGIGTEWLDAAPDQVPRNAPADGFLQHVGGLPLEAVVLVAASGGEATARLLLNRAGDIRVPTAVVAQIDLTLPDAAESIAALVGSSHGESLVGVRLAARSDDPRWAARASAGVSAAGLLARGLVVEILTGRRELPAVLEFAKSSEQPVVLDHLGGLADQTLDGTFWRQQLRSLAAVGTVNVKLSGWRTPERPGTADNVRFVVDEFGPGRVIFGSDWPLAAEAGTYADTVEATLSLLSWLDERDRDLVMRANALTLYAFDRAASGHAREPQLTERTP